MIALKSVEQWQALLQQSRQLPVIIFKRSNVCSDSDRAEERLLGAESSLPQPIYRLVVQQDRVLSDTIAETLGIEHQSPQMIIINQGQAVFDASHEAVEPEALAPYLE